jgi:hypothetical protein
LIDDGFHAGRGGGDVLGGEASRVVGHLAGKGDGAILGDDIDGGGFQERLGIELSLDACGDRVVAGLVAGQESEQEERECGE